MNNNEDKLTVMINNSKPVELADFSECLMGVGQQYIRYLSMDPDIAGARDIRLFVKDIRKGSIIADLIPQAPNVLPFIAHANSIIGFAKHLHDFGAYLLGSGEKPERIEKSDYENLNKIATPIAKDNAAQFNISPVIHGNVHIEQTFHFGSIEANAMQNVIGRDLNALKEPVARTYRKVLLFWYQARNDPKSTAGDRAIIESISPTPMKTIFAFEALKLEMLFTSQDNPFHFAYIVDVVVETIQDRPALYKIIEFHEKFSRTTEEDKTGQQSLF